jgi:hypothetical protein
MSKTELQKSIDAMVDELFAEEINKASENFEVASASKTTADAAVASAPKGQNDEARGAGRPKQISDVPESDEDGKRAGEYTASIAEENGEEEPEETKTQSKAHTQVSDGDKGPKNSMDPRSPAIAKSITAEEYAEFEAFKKSKADTELKKADDLRKAETTQLIKAAVGQAMTAAKKEADELRKSLKEQQELLKAMASQPQRTKAITSVHALSKSTQEFNAQTEFTKSEKLEAAEELVKKGKLPMDAVIELENTGTLYDREQRALIERELTKN